MRTIFELLHDYKNRKKWLRSKASFNLIRSELFGLRGSWAIRKEWNIGSIYLSNAVGSLAFIPNTGRSFKTKMLKNFDTYFLYHIVFIAILK